MIFKFLGIKITVSYLFCACFCIMALCDKTGLFMLMALAAFIHEIGHLSVMKIYNCLPNEIRLIPGSVQICSPVCSAKPTVLMLLAGPLLNGVICLILLLFNVFTDFAQINLIYAVFNLLPFYGLDGGGIIEEILIRKKGAVKSERIIKTFTLIGAAVIFLLALAITLLKSPNYSAYIVSLYFILSVIFKF